MQFPEIGAYYFFYGQYNMHSMPAYFTYKDQKTHVLLKLSGSLHSEVALEEAPKVWERMSRICREWGRNQALIIINLENHLHIGLSMELARLAEENGWERDYRLGIISDLENRMTMNLVKSFLKHRGYETEVFDNLKLARRWLSPEW